MITLHKNRTHELEPWPDLETSPGYRIVRGNPRTSGRFDVGGPGARLRLGVWACTAGAFECVESGNELQTIVSGRLRIIEADGTSHEFTAGDSIFTQKGEKVIWDIVEDVVKVFYAHDPDGPRCSE